MLSHNNQSSKDQVVLCVSDKRQKIDSFVLCVSCHSTRLHDVIMVFSMEWNKTEISSHDLTIHRRIERTCQLTIDRHRWNHLFSSSASRLSTHQWWNYQHPLHYGEDKDNRDDVVGDSNSNEEPETENWTPDSDTRGEVRDHRHLLNCSDSGGVTAEAPTIHQRDYVRAP